LISATFVVHVEDVRGVSADDESAILAAFSRAIETRSGRKGSIDLAGCKKKDRCAAELAERSGAEDVVFVRMIGVPTRVRILVERQPQKTAAEADLPRSRDGWEPVLAGLAEALFPEAKPRSETVATVGPKPEPPRVKPEPAPAVEPESSSLLPWIAFGAGAVALSVGTGFGLSSRDARDDARSRPHSDMENDALSDRAIGHGLAANVMFGTAVIAVGAGVLLLVLE
jgi:hypothetical protein